MKCRICEEGPAAIAGLCRHCHNAQIYLALELTDDEFAQIEDFKKGTMCTKS